MRTGILFVLKTGIPGGSENAKGKDISMRIIDTHVHVLDNYAPVDPNQERGENWFEGRCERLLQHMDECGVEKAVLVPVVAAYSPHNNEECAHLFDPDEPSYGGLLEGESPSNLFVKASGFYAAAATPWDFRCPRILGFIARLLDGLGTYRVLWGSDWPPAALHLTYRQNLELVRSFVERLDHGGRTLVLGENAARVYGI